MSNNNLDEKEPIDNQLENASQDDQVEAHASDNEVADTVEEDEVEATIEEEDDFTLEPIASPEYEVIPVEEFNWEAYEAMTDDYTSKDRNKLEDMYAETLSHVEERQVVNGKVVNITDRDVVVNIGFKSDGMVPLSEFKYRETINLGDVVEIMVEKREDHQGQIQLSHKKALAEKAWDTIVHAHENDIILRGYIKDRTKGGMVVDLLTMDAFLPGSQIDIKPIKDYDAYVGTHMDLKVVKINLQYRNIVVSHKAIIESDLEQQKTEILSKLEKGQVLEGVVKNLTSFGVFVDLGGVDGLIHITDVSWGRINHPDEVLELGQKINTVVLDYDEDKKRISLGLKQLTQHPWETLPAEVEAGSRIMGKVVNIEDYGAFVEIFPGVEGLVHVSEMSWSTHLKSPNEYVTLGKEVETVVLSIDREERKLALGMKQLSADPWSGIEEKYAIGSKHNAVVRSMTNFGLFVELEEGIDGLVHISDLSWTRKYSHAAEFTKVGEPMEVLVMEIDKENRRLSLGHKQLEEDPWDTFESIFLADSIHEGTITRMEEKGAIVTLPYGLEAYSPTKHITKQDKTRLREGDTVDFMILEFDKENKKILVSYTNVWRDEERHKKDEENTAKVKEEELTTKAVKKIKDSQNKDTLADANDILAGLKKNLEADEKKKQTEAIAIMDAKLKDDDKSEEGVAVESEAAESEAPVVEDTTTPVAESNDESTEEKSEE